LDVAGYILRIATKQWVEQVFDLAIYYTSISRRWKPGQTILFLHKTNVGDAFVGYGIIKRLYEKDELSEEDKRECDRFGWKKAIEFTYVVQFEKPLSIRETFLKGSKLRGRYLHGLKLTSEQLGLIISQAEKSQH